MRQTRPTCTTRRQCVTAIHDCVILRRMPFSFLSHKLSSPSAATMAASQERSTHARTKAMCIVRCVIISRRLPAMFVSHLPPPRSSSFSTSLRRTHRYRRNSRRAQARGGTDRSIDINGPRSRKTRLRCCGGKSEPSGCAPATADRSSISISRQPQRRSVGSTTELLRVR